MKTKNKSKINFAELNTKFGGVYALDFSSTIKQNSAYTIDQVYNALNSKDIQTLIEMSNYFFIDSGQYRRMINHIATLHTYSYIYTPIITDFAKGLNYKKLGTSIDKVTDYLSKSQVEATNKYITFECAINGTFYGYERDIDNQIVLQELPPSYCRTKYKINGNYAIEFNFKFFDDNYRDTNLKQQAFDMLPDEFLSLYNEYKSDTSNNKEKNWKLLNPDFTRCHRIVPDGTPFLAGTFPDLIDLCEFKEIQKAKSKLELYRIIVQKVPIDDNGEVSLEQDEVQDLHTATRKMVTNKQVEIITSPLETTSIDLSNKGQKDTDILADATASIYDSAGMSQVIFNNSKNNGLAGLKYSVTLDESILDDFIAQCQRWYNYKLSLITGKSIKFELEFLGITRNNKSDMIDVFRTSATLGGSVMAMLVATGIPQYKVLSLLDFENNFLHIKDKMIPLQTSYNTSSNDIKNNNGRPEKNEDDLSDRGSEQKDNETNKNRTQAN